MRKSLSYKVLLSVLALSTINYASPANVLAGVDAYNNYNVTYNGETVNGKYNNVYGNEHSFTINGGKIIGNVFGAGNGNKDYDKDASGGNVTINGNAEQALFTAAGQMASALTTTLLTSATVL